MSTDSMICKYCKRKGTYSFGWLDSKGEWHDKHLACEEHAPISIFVQKNRVEIEQMRERWGVLSAHTMMINIGTP